ncbi:hypothetical protein ACFQZB_07195 [Arthrobacter ulcerisalmonis]
MDAIKNLVAGADPVSPNPTEADGEKALQLMFARPEVFADRVPKDIPTLAERRQRRNRVLGLSVLATAAATAGVLVSINLGPLTAAPAPANTVAAAPSESPSSTATAAPETMPPAITPPPPIPTQAKFDSANAGLSFDLPTGWTATEVPAGTPDFPATGVEVADEVGKKVASLYYGTGGGLGGSCGPGPYTQAELDSAQYSAAWAQPDVRFSYRVLDQTSSGGGFAYQAGLVDASSGQLQDSCLMYSVVAKAPEEPCRSRMRLPTDRMRPFSRPWPRPRRIWPPRNTAT